MGQDFYRRVCGYNKYSKTHGSANLIRNQWLGVVPPSGPGQIEDIFIFVDSIDPTVSTSNSFVITIDGTDILNIWLCDFTGGLNDSITHGIKSSMWIGSEFTYVDIAHVIDYSSSAKVWVQNTKAPDPCWFFIYVYTRTGV